MFHEHDHSRGVNFYGTGTIGEKGQIVIPAKARDNLGIKPGDDFIFFGRGPMIFVAKTDQINSILDKMTEQFAKFSEIREEIKKHK